MAKELLFSRHGESVVNISRTISNRITDYAPLSENGRNQAKELAKVLGQQQLSMIYTSPIARAYETAHILGTELDVQVNREDGLREPDCGELEGRSDEEAWERYAMQEEEWRNGHSDYSVPGGESLQDVINRFVPSIQRIVSTHRNDIGSVLLVSHGSVLRHMLPYIAENVTSRFTYANPLQNCSFVAITPTDTGLTCTEWDGVKDGF